MRAFVAEKTDDGVTRGLREDFELDSAGDDVVVDVEYSSVNYKDGLATIAKGQVARISPLVPGIDLAGVTSSGEAVLAHRAPGVSYSALCPNARGLERAKAAGIEEVAVFLSASETHNKKNVNKTIDDTLAAFTETIGPARAAGIRVRGYVSTVWGCPYEGSVSPDKSIAIANSFR